MNALVPSGGGVARRPDADSVRIVAAWLAKLAKLTKATAASPSTPARLQEMALFLLAIVPSAAFTENSMRAILRGMEFFPAVDVLQRQIVEYWNLTKPASAPHIGPGPVRVSPPVERKISAILDPAGECARLRAEAGRFASEWADGEAVQRSVARLRGEPMAGVLGRLLGAAVAKHAPENLSHVPEEWRP